MTHWAPRYVGEGRWQWVRYPMPQLVAVWRERWKRTRLERVTP